MTTIPTAGVRPVFPAPYRSRSRVAQAHRVLADLIDRVNRALDNDLEFAVFLPSVSHGAGFRTTVRFAVATPDEVDTLRAALDVDLPPAHFLFGGKVLERGSRAFRAYATSTRVGEFNVEVVAYPDVDDRRPA